MHFLKPTQEKKGPMKLTTATLVAITGLGLCVVPVAFAADDSFVGKWKMNVDKCQFTGLQYKIENLGGDKYSFVFGDDVETVPLDGKDHPTKYGNTWAIAKTGPNKWKWTQKRDGKIISVSNWTISEDGIFNSHRESMRPDGSTSHVEVTFKRTAGTSGLAGTWESTEFKMNPPATLEIEKWQVDGYSLLDPAYKEREDFKLDGKDYTPKGPRVPKGTTVSGKAIDAHKMELTYKLKGKTTETDSWELSEDGKTLTETLNFSGVSKPELDVYERQ
jgi:hypothetical protein